MNIPKYELKFRKEMKRLVNSYKLFDRIYFVEDDNSSVDEKDEIIKKTIDVSIKKQDTPLEFICRLIVSDVYKLKGVYSVDGVLRIHNKDGWNFRPVNYMETKKSLGFISFLKYLKSLPDLSFSAFRAVAWEKGWIRRKIIDTGFDKDSIIDKSDVDRSIDMSGVYSKTHVDLLEIERAFCAGFMTADRGSNFITDDISKNLKQKWESYKKYYLGL